MPRFSSRLRWESPRNPLALHLEEIRRRGAGIIDLTRSNPTQVGLPYPEAEIRSAFGIPEALLYEPAARGLPEARRAIAAWETRGGLETDPERLVLTAGTSEAYAFLFNMLLDPAEEVLIPRPSYPLLELLAQMAGVRLVPYALHYDGRWRLDLEMLRRAAGPRARAIVVVHPNNPTGSFLHRDEAAGLRRLCQERDLALISDEVFSGYALMEDRLREPTLAGSDEVLTFRLDGLSKSAGLPQAKLAWIRVDGPEPAVRQALDRLDLVADTFLSVGGPVQHAARRLLELGERVRQQILGRLLANLAALRTALQSHPTCTLLEPEGGWSAILRLPAVRSDEEWALTLLEKDRVLVQPGYFYDFEQEALVVLSLLPATEEFAAGIHRLLRRVEAA